MRRRIKNKTPLLDPTELRRKSGKNQLLTKDILPRPDSPCQCFDQNLSSLVDLAQHEFDTNIEQAQRLQAAADLHRRRAFAAWDNLRAYQKLIPPTTTPGGQAR